MSNLEFLDKVNLFLFNKTSKMIKRILAILFLIISSKLSADEVRLHDLKVKLKPKVTESKVYWQGVEEIDWEKEIENWHFGFLSFDEDIPPIIIDKKNFYPTEEDYQEKYLRGKNNMGLLVFNPLSTKVQCCLEFFAASHKKEKTLEIWLGNKIIDKIKVPAKKEFSHFGIENILLKPGINEIRFFSPNDPDKLRPKKWKKEKGEVNIKVKGFRFRNLRAIQTVGIEGLDSDIKYVLQDSLLDIIFPAAKPAILSREIEVDLEEFPLFNLKAEFKRETDTQLITFLGVDYTDDDLIDDYLNLGDLGEYNLFELAKDKWQELDEYKNKFKLKRIILLLLPEKSKIKGDQIGILKLKDINLYNDNSIILVRREFNKDQLRFEDININSQIIEEKNNFFLMSYFDAADIKLSDDNLKEERTMQKKREFEETQIYVLLDKKELKDFPYFSFKYRLDDSQIQDIELALLREDKGRGKLFNLTENQYEKLEEGIEINLKEMDFKGLDIKGLIIRLKRRDDADCSLPEKRGWYQFQLSDLKLYEKFPYPLKSQKIKEEFVSLLQSINPEIVKIDDTIFHLNDFSGWQKLDLERGVLVRRIELLKGNHKYEKLDNTAFELEWAILEPVHSPQPTAHSKEEPEIAFKKINPTKYLVKIERAKEPFWLVFSESFHKQWRLYKLPVASNQLPEFGEIVADYPKLKVKEAKHLMKFTPEDIKYLFKKPLEAEHHLVNGYANGWYIEPEKLGLGENFVLVIYFWPQSLFYLGLGISGLTLLSCIGYLLWGKRKTIN